MKGISLIVPNTPPTTDIPAHINIYTMPSNPKAGESMSKAETSLFAVIYLPMRGVLWFTVFVISLPEHFQRRNKSPQPTASLQPRNIQLNILRDE